jgi:hypothetical protein
MQLIEWTDIAICSECWHLVGLFFSVSNQKNASPGFVPMLLHIKVLSLFYWRMKSYDSAPYIFQSTPQGARRDVDTSSDISIVE